MSGSAPAVEPVRDSVVDPALAPGPHPVAGQAPPGRSLDDGRPWLAHPVVDVLVGAGLLALPALVGTAAAAGRFGGATVVVVAALTAALFHPHVAATVVRAWRLGGSARLVLQAATAVAIVAALFLRVQPGLLPALFTVWLVVSPFHAAGQNARVGALLARRAHPGASDDGVVDRAMRTVHHVLAAGAVVALLVGPREPLLYRLGLPAAAAVAAAVVALAVAAVVVVVVAVRLRRRGTPRRAVALLLLPATTSAVWFAVPALVSWQGAFVYAGGIVGVLHGAQALWLLWFVEGRKAHDDSRTFDSVAWIGLALAGGVALFVLLPWCASKLVGDDLLIALLGVQGLVNIHHVVVDAAAVRAARGSSAWAGHARAPSGRQHVSNARAAAWTVPAVLLLLLGALDVLQLAGSTEGFDGDDRALARALVWNDNDSRLWVRQADQALAAGDVDGARANLGRALTLSRWNSDAQARMLQVHVASARDDEARALWLAMPPSLSSLPSVQALAAGVALRTGRLDEAVGLASTVLAATDEAVPGLALEARGILGAALFAQGKAAEARVPLKDALDRARAARGEDALAQGDVPDVGLALAEVDLSLGQHDPALVTLERVLDGAQRTRRVDVTLRAQLLRAAVFQRRADAREALATYQRALQAARAQKEQATTPSWRRDMARRVAQGWLDYGGLLAQSDAPMRARLACALLARDAASAMPDGAAKKDLLAFIDDAAGYVIAVLPAADVDALRADLDRAAGEALALSYPDAPVAPAAPAASP
jgi:tetratricopeptide (TPR) repeat protein